MKINCIPALARLSISCSLLLGASPAAALAVDAGALAQMSLEELMAVEVTSVAGIGQSRFTSPAALFVLTADDIRRAGHRNLAEALRLVPGMYVARINSSSWVVGARGLTGSSLTATRYLVLIDGRVVHDPLLSGTFWDVTDLPLADIERIEVIRGPGATLWGVNAMNGVINVITLSARDTQGALVELGGGDFDQSDATLRYGGAGPGDSAYRIWARYAQHGDTELADGASVVDQWASARSGFRFDSMIGEQRSLMVEGDLYTHPRARFSLLRPLPGAHLQSERVRGNDAISGGHLLARVRDEPEPGHGWSAQAYVDRTERETARFGVERTTFDVDWRHWRVHGRHQWIMGLQYTTNSDELSEQVLRFSPRSRTWGTANAFIQDTIELDPGKWFLMLGSKLTHHEFVGVEVQPSIRLWWTPSEQATWWAAISRPVRVPSRFEEDGSLIFNYADSGLLFGRPATGAFIPLALSGDDSLRAETMIAYEIGNRFQIGDRLTVSTQAFFNDYQRLISVPTSIIGTFTDLGYGETYGLEVQASWQALPNWRLEGAYSWLGTDIHGPVLPFEEESTPEQLAYVRSALDLGEDLELNTVLYHVDRIPQSNIDAYERLDLGLTWRPRADLELAVWAQNLSDAEHREGSGAMIPRSVHAQLTWRMP